MAEVIVLGGGLAGLAAAAALGSAGHSVRLFEARPFLGGRATSYGVGDETVDNCQHVLLRCCVNLLDFYRRLGVDGEIQFHQQFTFIEPGGRRSVLRAGPLREASFLGLRFLGAGDKLGIVRALLELRREWRTRGDLDRITMLQWLQEKRQTAHAVERFWRQVLVSAVNEELDRMAARHGFQVFWLGFLARSDACQMGVPAVPLGRLYRAEVWQRLPSVKMSTRAPVERIVIQDGAVQAVLVDGRMQRANHYVCALPFERLPAVGVPTDVSALEHSPITGIHLWFDRRITGLPHAALLDRTIQWVFNKAEGRYLQVVVSASRSLVEMPRNDVIALAVRELAEFFPLVAEAKLEKAHVVKEVRATFSARPGLEGLRPGPRTEQPNLFLAGDWTRSGWPATMEGAVRSGYLAAEAVAEAAGAPGKFLLPDIA